MMLTVLGSKLWSSTTNVDHELNTLKDKIEHLTAQRSDNLAAAQHAEIQPGKRQKTEVKVWSNMVDERVRNLQEIESQLENHSPTKELRDRIGRETRQVQELIEQGKFPCGVVLDDHDTTRVPMVPKSSVGQSFDDNINEISRLLKDDSVCLIAVQGMGGVGKTSLLTEIYNHLLQDSDIDGQVYWVTASQDCSLEKLQILVGKRLGLETISEEHYEMGRRSLIFHRLSQLKKSVLIIDDIWKHFLTDEIGIPLNCCKVLITTRSLEVCNRMGCKKIIQILPLLWEDSWSLFVERSGGVQNALIPIAKQMVEECGGLPLALITVGCCMRNVGDIHEWKTALDELKRPDKRLDHDMDEKVFRVLLFSYDNLKDEKVKQCFLNCVLFPEDSEIERGKLIDLWIVEGLLDEFGSWEDKVNRGHTILNRLENLSLLESTMNYFQKRCVKMHDLIRDMALIITKIPYSFMVKAGMQLLNIPEAKHWSKDLVKVSLSHNRIEEIPCGMSPETPQLKVLILSNNPLKQIPDSFFVHMKALQVLDLSETKIKKLPDTVSDLVNLRGLLVDECHALDYVPSLAKLTKLIALVLPFDSHLLVEEIGVLKCLEKLSNCILRLSDLPSFNMISCQLHVYKINLLGSNRFHEVPVRTPDYEKSMTIQMGKFGESEIVPQLPSNIQCLEINYNSFQEQTSLGDVFPSLNAAIDLKELELCDCIGLEYICSKCPPFDALEHLMLSCLPDLRRITKMRYCSSFSHLIKLVIFRCPKLKVVFPLMQQNCLPFLEYVIVQDCAEIEEIFETKTREFAAAFNLPNLKLLCLYGLPKLGYINTGLHLSTSLEEIYITSCPKLETIFNYPTLKDQHNENTISDLGLALTLPNLKQLELEGLNRLRSVHFKGLKLSTSLEKISIQKCPELEGVFSPPTRGMFSTTIELPNLIELHLRNLPKLRNFYRGLILCPSLSQDRFDVDESMQVKKQPGSQQLFCDTCKPPAAGFLTICEDTLEGCQPFQKRLFQPNNNVRPVAVDDEVKKDWGKTLSLSFG